MLREQASEAFDKEYAVKSPDSYRGDLVRLPIGNAATMLQNLDISDEDGIVRT